MSSSSRPKIRIQLAKHLKKKSNSALKIQSSVSGRKESLFNGEKKSTKNSGKRKVVSDVGFEKRVLRRKNQLGDGIEKNVKIGSILSEDEEENVGFGVLGKRFIVPNSSSSSSSSEDESGFEVLGERIGEKGSCSKNVSVSRLRKPLVSNVVKGKNTKPVSPSSSSEDEGGFELCKGVVKKGSCSKNASVARLRSPLVSNVVRNKNSKPVSPSSSSEDESEFEFSGKSVVKKGSCLKNASVSRLRPQSVSNVVRNKKSKPFSSSSSSEDESGLGFSGKRVVRKGSCLKNAIVSRFRPQSVSNVVKDKNSKPVSSSSSSEDDEDGGFEIVGVEIVNNGSRSKNASNSRFRTPPVSNKVRDKNTEPFTSSSSSESRTPNDVRDENTGSDHSVGVNSTLGVDGFVENVGGDLDESIGRLLDKKKYEIELSSDEEEDKDDAEMESEEDDRLFSSDDDDSLDEPYSPSDNDALSENDVVVEKMIRSGERCKRVNLKTDDAVERNENTRDIGTGREENDVLVEEPLISGKKCKRVSQKKDFAVELNKNRRDTGTGGEQNQNDVVVEKSFTSGKKGKTVNRKKYFAVELNKEKRDDGKEVIVDFDRSSDEEEKCSKSQEKDPQVGNFEPPKPVMECEAPKDDESNSSKRECSSEKKPSCEEEIGKQRKSSARTAELIRSLLNTVNEARNVEESVLIHEPLPLKFRFEDEVTNPPTEQTEWDEEIDSLFHELNYCLRILEIDSANLSKNKMVNEGPAASCDRGVHDSVLDEQIGNVCRFCGVILLEIKDILPPWHTRSKRHERKYFGESPNPVNDELQSYNSINIPNEPMVVRGTVWDLIPGFEKNLFPHQCEGFEFLWKNIAGDIAIEKLPASLSGEGRGCIISHAPGTGKTRLAVVFLLSFLKRYPNARPVILAPQAILSTWENEFVKWKVDISFHNMNNPKLSGNETQFDGETEVQDVRLVKLLSWIGGGGILGISYTLFKNFAGKGEKGGDEQAIWDALVKMPGLLVLDEGHVPRNVNGCIGNAIKKVTTKRCIMLSGTPFQNNFEELKTTLGLVDPSFHKMDKNSWAKLTEGKDELEELRSRLDPFVHYHKRSALQKSLPGLKDTMIFLRPGEFQKTLMDACKNEETAFLTSTYLVSLISVHPSALMVDEKTKFAKSEAFSSYKDRLEEIESDLDEGVKIKFVMNLIQLADALGERVLVFSHYTYPLMFIKKQLETHFSWKEGREVLYMDGKLEEKRRQQSISSFNNSSSKAKVLLASLTACSEGINLIGASRVVLLTTAWNPSVERQAISRAYRFGQKKVVYVYRLITSGMEVRQYELQAKKDRISQLIFSHVDEQAEGGETSSEIFEDNIMEQMQNLESFKNIFEKIIHQPKESDFLENFRFKDP